jgi:hypothetical protein
MAKTKKPKDPMPDAGGDAGAAPVAAVMVTVVRTAEAPKLNPARGGGGITYQIGRIDREVYLRLKENDGGGRFSREWVPFERMRTCFSPAVLTGQPFKAHVLDSAFQGRSTTNAGFLTAVIRAEQLAREDTEHRGMSLLNGGYDTWTQGVLDAKPEKNDDGTDKLEPLHPPAKESPFKALRGVKRADGVETPSGDDETGTESGESSDAQPCAANT